jgi:hypothetical protein
MAVLITLLLGALVLSALHVLSKYANGSSGDQEPDPPAAPLLPFADMREQIEGEGEDLAA